MWLLLLLLLLHTRLLEEEHALELGKTCKLGQGLRLLEQGCRRWHLPCALLLQGHHLLQGGRHDRAVRSTLAGEPRKQGQASMEGELGGLGWARAGGRWGRRIGVKL